MMNCTELITEFLADYVDARLDEQTLADFEHHLDVCPSCVDYLRTYRDTIALATATRTTPPDLDDAPEELIAAILATRRR
jgi:predicted anti-sigma-YlaC factor YlaD